MKDISKSDELQVHVQDIMTEGLELVDLFVNKNYLIDLNLCDPIPLGESEKTFSVMSLYQLDKIVYDQNENINDKLVSVYSALSNFGSTALLLIVSDKEGVKFYLGTRDTNQPSVAKEILKKSLHGNFPGIHILEQDATMIESILEEKIPTVYSNMAVTSVSIVPSMRDEDDKDRFIQGIEKFIDSMAKEEYTAIFVSSPLSKQELVAKKRGYEELYTALSQCAELVMSYGVNDSEAVAVGISNGFSKAVNDGISDTTGKNSGTNTSKGRSHNRGSSFGMFGTSYNSGRGSNHSKGTYEGTSDSHTETYSETNTSSDTKSSTTTNTKGSSTSLQITRHNKTIEELLVRIDEQLERIKNCESYGLWDSACYFVANSQEVSIVAANTYKALVAGEKTSVENSFINLWGNEFENAKNSLSIMDYLRYGMHPRFTYKAISYEKDYENQEITPASLISGLELPILMGLPHKSVSGVTSIESAEFGRNVFTKSHPTTGRSIDLGAIYHMGEIFDQNRVKLDVESLTSHCFITGSTGSGKSNTTYKLIDELIASKNDVKFLVIEPAKGEYKLAFGGMPGIHIFTTNPKYHSMLSINPFSFQEEIHVLEHLDRLIEIFSACWPLYAAMPAVLKSSFERAYIKHGWDLNHSIYTDMGNGKFPNLYDIVEILPIILNESEFSDETKGNYIGSLVTRVESLTNGLLGQIFNSVAIEDEILFNENTIVDLSRVGSNETKALLMGLLVLKLSEFRQSTSRGVNIPLQHVTIMEEAHNLLKRTSTEQGQESANVQGKSVEMISNSIAEMRTYGEGFIIVDQSPTAVDISAIKNTNTKIVMRLPEASDCEAIGHSIGLTPEQIMELSRLDKGVAAIFQTDWLESVLTKIDKCSEQYERSSSPINDRADKLAFIGEILEELIRQDEDKNLNIPWLKDIITQSKLNYMDQVSIHKQLQDYEIAYEKGNQNTALSALIVNLLNCNDLIRIYADTLPPSIQKKSQMTTNVCKQAEIWCECVYKGLDSYAKFYHKHTKDIVMMNLVLHQINSTQKSDPYKFILYMIKHPRSTEDICKDSD